MEILRGQILLISSGEYSDYGLQGLFTAKTNFDFHEVKEKYLELHPEERGAYCGSLSGFTAFLATQGLVSDLDYREIHIGSYGSIDPMEPGK